MSDSEPCGYYDVSVDRIVCLDDGETLPAWVPSRGDIIYFNEPRSTRYTPAPPDSDESPA